MVEQLITGLAIVGGLVVAILIVSLITILIGIASDKVEKAKRKHKIKHRFDKPPMAKCYCVDCTYYEQYDTGPSLGAKYGKCLYRNKAIADNEFCSSAKPVSKGEKL